MKNKRWIAVFLACQALTILAAFNPTATAQTRVAIVDIGAVFKGHAMFTQQLETLRSEAEQFKASSLQLQQQLVQKAEVLKQYTPGSSDFKTAESSLAQESAKMEVEQRDQMRRLMQSEARLHLDTYTEVNQLVSDYCDQAGVQLVLRFNGQPMVPKNPGTIMQRVNGSIVYYDANRDITPQIIAAIAQKNATANRNTGTTPR